MDLVDLINSGTVWAFVGSGVSSDAGCPSWHALVDSTLAALDADLAGKVRTDPSFAAAYEGRNFPKCFSRIQRIIGSRRLLDETVHEYIGSVRSPGRLGAVLADWPFAGYITTNYDMLLEAALQGLNQSGWSSVGNSDFEVRKLSGDAQRVVWHIHGGVGLPETKSRLILTSEDYDDCYLETSPMVSQLRALLTQRRVVFIGFGFQDQEVLRVLKLVGRLCSPARPAFAFLHGIWGKEHREERRELLELYNVDVIPYLVEGNSHRQLHDLLETYGSFVLRRSQRFGRTTHTCPSYDPETTGLLIYNQALGGGLRLAQDVLGSIIQARILSLLQFRGSQSIDAIYSDIRERAAAISPGEQVDSGSTRQVDEQIRELERQGYIGVDERSQARTIELTTQGAELAKNQAARAERLSEQFSASVSSRVGQRGISSAVALARVAGVVESFLKECVQRRSLGVAIMWGSSLSDTRSYQMVALMQALPEFLEGLENSDEAKVVIRVVTDVFARPTEAERTYLGLLLQAQFGLHLLGYDPSTLRARSHELARTLFLIDSTTLIPLVARSSPGNESARLLVQKLSSVGAGLVTTVMLAEEATEHARWPFDAQVISSTGHCTVETAKVSLGKAGYRSNAFLEGFLEEAGTAEGSLNFLAYLQSICSCRLYDPTGLASAIRATLVDAGIQVLGFDEWEGFFDELWVQRDDVASKITEQRIASKTYRHERQVKAEAEALIVIEGIRESRLKLHSADVRDAYFVSRTRVLDTVSGAPGHITMRPEAVLHWLATVTPSSIEELGLLMNSLLWELSERGFAIIDTSHLQMVFSPLISAAKEQLHAELQRHRLLISAKYGENASSAFGEAPDVSLPIVMESYFAQMSQQLEQTVAIQQTQLEELGRREARIEAVRTSQSAITGSGRLSDAERAELERLRAEKQSRADKNARRKRRSSSKRRK